MTIWQVLTKSYNLSQREFLQVYSIGIGLNSIRFDRIKRRAERELVEIAETESNVYTVDEVEELSENLEDITRIAWPPRVYPAA